MTGLFLRLTKVADIPAKEFIMGSAREEMP
jgi:hypothetical protein